MSFCLLFFCLSLGKHILISFATKYFREVLLGHSSKATKFFKEVLLGHSNK